MARTYPLVTGNVYHAMNKSIAGYTIFSSDADYVRMRQILQYFTVDALLPKFSTFLKSAGVQHHGFSRYFSETIHQAPRHVHIIAYCLMPTHLHLVVRQEKDEGISTYLANVLNAYARYFNTKYKRKGPLWVGRFKSVPVESDEQLLHLTRYVHLNPVTSRLVSNAATWQHSSFGEYVSSEKGTAPAERLCGFEEVLTINPAEYAAFVAEQIPLQRELAALKKIALE